jgi:hypothetical protein
MVEEVEGALNGVLESLKEEGLIAAVLRSGNAPVFPRAYVMLRTVEISTRSIGRSSTRSNQEYELVFEGLGADPIEQYGKVLRAALRAYELIRQDPTLGLSGADVLASPVELRRTDYVDQGRRAIVLSMTVRVSVESTP